MVYIILINYQGWADTIECVESLQKSTYQEFRVVIVDNQSPDGSVAILSRHFKQEPKVKIISNNQNSGFSGGNNLGIEYAVKMGAQYIWLLNNDTVVDPNSLQQLVDYAKSAAKVLFGGRVYLFGQKEKLWFAGGTVNWWKGRARHIDEDHNSARAFFTTPQQTEWISGCSMFARAEVFAKCRLDERYFLYFEDVDYAVKLRKAGISLMVVPDGNVWHKNSSTMKKMNGINVYYGTRNNMIFMKRHAKWRYKVYFFPYFTIRTFIIGFRQFLKGLAKNDDSLKTRGKYFIKGISDFYLGREGKLTIVK